MYDLGGIVGIGAHMKAEVSRQIAHVQVLRQIHRIHSTDATLSRDLDQVLHQRASEALVLPFISDGHGAFAGLAVRRRAVATGADDALGASFRNHRDEGDFVFGIDIGELIEQLLAGATHLPEKTESARLRRQPLQETAFGRAVLRRNGPDHDVAAVAQGLGPSQRC